jgi:hypothetical protein
MIATEAAIASPPAQAHRPAALMEPEKMSAKNGQALFGRAPGP